MARVIKLHKGLDIRLAGAPAMTLTNPRRDDGLCVLAPEDITGFTPKVLVRPGDAVRVGSPVMADKAHPEIKVVSPVSGTIEAVNRGERRRVLNIVIRDDGRHDSLLLPIVTIASASPAAIRQAMLDGGVWPYIHQRPYDTVACPTDTPRDIFVTGFDSAPLAPDFALAVGGEETAFQTALTALSRLTDGHVYLGVREGDKAVWTDVTTVEFAGPHPAGNVGVQINHIRPVNKGEVVWTASAFDLITVGRILMGHADYRRTVSIAGSEVVNPACVKVVPGTTIAALTAGNVRHADYAPRFIAGNVLTGRNAGPDGALGFYDNSITVIPDGRDTTELFGWATPGLSRYSTSFTCLSALRNLFDHRPWTLDARLKGGRRALIVSGQWEKVFPMDIYPEQLYKATLAFDIDKMEALGIYEVAPEDFALCEFVDASKTEVQQVIADGLARLKKEME